MSFKKILCSACCALLCFPFAACENKPHDGTDGKPDYSDGEIPDDNDVKVSEPETTEHDFALVSNNNGTLVYKCTECNERETVVITYVSGTENAYAVDGNTITFGKVSANSVYDIRGSLHGNIVIDAGDSYKFELQMSGFEINSASVCPIAISSGDKVTLSAKKSTDNNIFDTRAAIDSADKNSVAASVYAECDLDIQGKGSLNVKSVNNDGIHTKDDLSVKNLSLQVDCIDNALKGNDSVTIESGKVILISRQGDGIKTTNSNISSKGNQRGTVKISGGDILVYAACDGIDAAYDAVIDESTATATVQVFTDKYSKYSGEVTAVADSVCYVRFNSTAYKYSLKFYNDDTDAVWHNSSTYKTVSAGGPQGAYYYYPIEKPSGYAYVQLYIYGSTQAQGQDDECVARTDGMAVNENYDTIALQAKGNNLTYGWTNYTTQQNSRPGGFGGMNDGNTDKGDHSTKGIAAGNAVKIAAGTVTVSAYDDAIHADNSGALENGATPLGNVSVTGGSLALRSNDDALHADGKVSIGGGSVRVVSSYEGIEGNTVEITGGTVSVVSTDDGINGTATTGTTITISGGNLYVYASGDGIDSNSQTQYEGIVFSGGKSVIISTGQADSSIDTERGYKYTGGSVIAIGRSGGMGNEATNCSGGISSVGTSKTLSLQKDGYLVVSDFGTVKMPVAMNAIVVCLGKTNASISFDSSTSYDLDADGVYWNVK